MGFSRDTAVRWPYRRRGDRRLPCGGVFPLLTAAPRRRRRGSAPVAPRLGYSPVPSGLAA